MKKEKNSQWVRALSMTMLLGGMTIGSVACVDGSDASLEGKEKADINAESKGSKEKVVEAKIDDAKVAESVWRHFADAEDAASKVSKNAALANPARILVFHRFEEHVRVDRLAFNRATADAMKTMEDSVASQQDRVVEQIGKFNKAMQLNHPSLRIIDRPLYNYFVVMEADRRADVEWLAKQRWVTEIREDKLNRLFTVEGRQLVGSDVAEQAGYDGDGIGIAIVDTNFDLLHPELGGSTSLPNGTVFGGYNFSDPGDPIHSQTFDDCYHGTGTLSIARRYAPEADMYGLTVFPNAYDSVIVNAINWCISNKNGTGGGAPIRIISMSLGGGAYSNYCNNDTIGQAAGNALSNGIVTFVASGNDGYTSQIASPACSPNVISVGSVWDEDGADYTPFYPAYCTDNNRLVNERTCYSNTAPILDIYAPSEEVICAQCGGGTWALGGTSSACPAAAGMTAQLFNAKPALIGNMNGILQLYQSTGVTVVGDSDEVRIDLMAAINSGGCTPHDDAVCYNGDVYWYDSCGNREEMKTSCNGQGCSNGACLGSGTVTYDSTDTPMSIPDNDSTGITSTIAVSESQTVTGATLDLDITHTYIGDLIVELTCPNGATQTLHNQTGGSADDIHQTYTITACVGQPAAGNWRLTVKDRARYDVGTLDGWTLDLELDGSGGGDLEETSTDTPMSIPDNDSTGVTSTISVSQSGTISDLSIDVDITHTYIGDLIVELTCPSGTSAVLHNGSGGSADDIHNTYQVTACNGESMAGDWELKVSDRARYDVGTLDEWTLNVTYQ